MPVAMGELALAQNEESPEIAVILAGARRFKTEFGLNRAGLGPEGRPSPE